MGVSLKALLPAFVSTLSGVSELLDTMTFETQALERAAAYEHAQFSASTAVSGLAEWERELALSARPDLDEQSRRALVLAALSFFSPCTPKALSALYAKMTGGQVDYCEAPEEFRIELSTVTPGRIVADLPGIYDAVSKLAPAHVYCKLTAEGDLCAQKIAHNALHAMVNLHIYTA